MRSGTSIVIVLVACVFQAGVVTQPAETPVPSGAWGGKGIQLTVTKGGAKIDYGCDVGTIDEPMLADCSGAFVAPGTHSFGRGGPRSQGDPPAKPRRARYEGTVNGNTMRLTASLPELQRKIGEFTLELGQRAVLERCG